MKPVVFIDGEAGTTGLQIHNLLSGRNDIELISLPENERRNLVKRSEIINDCNIAILCLPDDAAMEAVSFIQNTGVRILDASSAHRTAKSWVYGLPELEKGHIEKISLASRVSNPGCYPTGAILMLRPLILKGILPPHYPINIHATSGYSGSGKALINAYEDPNSTNYTTIPFCSYGLNLNHKHLPEIQSQSLLDFSPIFSPNYGNYRQGIILNIPIHLRLLPDTVTPQQVRDVLTKYYEGSRFIKVMNVQGVENTNQLHPEYLNNTNELHIYVFSNENNDQILLSAVYDNLGKGAARAAVQNLNLMLNVND
ncbi:N-acetyl-gamma-glutamyl-phosphate reductase [Acinetobacter baumannii]|nr:N-acetyl-gamma-glutamyl-phosphate reductase [Acinetobacter baumannii]